MKDFEVRLVAKLSVKDGEAVWVELAKQPSDTIVYGYAQDAVAKALDIDRQRVIIAPPGTKLKVVKAKN